MSFANNAALVRNLTDRASVFPESASEGFLLCTSLAGVELSFPGRCGRGAVVVRSWIRRPENFNFPPGPWAWALGLGPWALGPGPLHGALTP